MNTENESLKNIVDLNESNNAKNQDVNPIVDETVIDSTASLDNSSNKDKNTSKNSIVNNIAKGIGIKIAEVILVVALLFGGWYLIKVNPFNWNFPFYNEELKIDKTANVVDKIKKISEFTTLCYYEEVVLKSDRVAEDNNVVANFLKIKADSIHEEVVIIAKGKVRAGFDFAKLMDEDIAVKSDTLAINLPSPEIFEVIANPSDYEIFVEEGEWTHEDISLLQMTHRNQLLESAIKADVIQKAASVGKNKVEELFQTFGFNVVEIKVKESDI